MKMSGTILSKISGGLASLISPVSHGISGWATSHAEQHRQAHIANSFMPGASLRRYLDSQKFRRELDTEASTKLRQSRAATRAYRLNSSSTGTDKDGNDTWKSRPNRYTRRAKLAAFHDSTAQAAQAAYKNTLEDYNQHFTDAKSMKLGKAHGRAYEDIMKQQFLSANIAQSDQDYLLSQYMKASTNRAENPYEYNRLINSAAGSLGHKGRSSIMGQVIAESARIESRRRQEGRIIINKMGYSKSDFRAMAFDTAHMDDDGYETDEKGRVLQDKNYNMLPGEQHQHWQQYIAVHKETGDEISKDRYDALDEKEKEKYERINYLHINDDRGKPVATVYADDAGYMKEILADDINIGDPINKRYLASIGKQITPEELEKLQNLYHVEMPKEFANKDGILRRYHGVIATALLDSGYKAHAAEVTPMLTSHTNNGFVLTVGQSHIASLDSLVKATKPGTFLQNDPFAIQNWETLIRATYFPTEQLKFEDIISDMDIAMFRNVNGLPLHGLRLVTQADGTQKWEKIERTDPTITLEDRKNFVKRVMIPAAAKKLIGMSDRRISPQTLDNQKPGTLAALEQLEHAIGEAALHDLDSRIAYSDKISAEYDFFEKSDPEILRDNIRLTRSALARARSGEEDYDEIVREYNDPNSRNGGESQASQQRRNRGSNNQRASQRQYSNGRSNSYNNDSSPNSRNDHNTNNRRDNRNDRPRSDGLNAFNSSIDRANDAIEREERHANPAAIVDNVESICNSHTDYHLASQALIDYLKTIDDLADIMDDVYAEIAYVRDMDLESETRQRFSAANFHDQEETRIRILQVHLLTMIRDYLYSRS